MTLVCIGLGSNIGDRRSHLDRAVQMLSRVKGVRLVARSRDYETAPFGLPPGAEAQPPYLNGAVLIETELPARQLLCETQKIEAALGRPAANERVRMAARTIDLDILLYGDAVIHEPGLAVPHPRLHLRHFALEPLAEIAPGAVHPLLGATVAQMLAWLSAGRAGEGPAGGPDRGPGLCEPGEAAR